MPVGPARVRPAQCPQHNPIPAFCGAASAGQHLKQVEAPGPKVHEQPPVQHLVPAPVEGFAGKQVIQAPHPSSQIFPRQMDTRLRPFAGEIEHGDVPRSVPLAVGQPEEALLQDGIAPVPQGQGEAQPLPVVGDAGDAVLAPAVGAGAGMVVGEKIPGVAVFAVVLPDRPSLPLRKLRPPFFPKNTFFTRFIKPDLFGGHGAPRSEWDSWLHVYNVQLPHRGKRS